jgi:hypothetical protein
MMKPKLMTKAESMTKAKLVCIKHANSNKSQAEKSSLLSSVANKLSTVVKRAAFLSLTMMSISLMSVSFASHAALPSPVSESVPNAEVVGKDMFTYYLFDVYEATLFAPKGEYEKGKPIALTLKYQRSLDGKKIAERSIDEMKKQAKLDSDKAKRWLKDMVDIFPDVKEGDVLTGVATEEGNALFYFNGENAGEVKDPEFTQKFFDIWLGENTSEPKFRRALLGIK